MSSPLVDYEVPVTHALITLIIVIVLLYWSKPKIVTSKDQKKIDWKKLIGVSLIFVGTFPLFSAVFKLLSKPNKIIFIVFLIIGFILFPDYKLDF